MRSRADALPSIWLLCAAALLLRLAVPGGWMPVADAHGVHIAPCPGAAAMSTAMPMPMAGKHHGRQPHPMAGDQSCPFAALGLTLAPAWDGVAFWTSPPAYAAAPVAAPAAGVGRGLAAPPPPATGPPAFA